MGPFLNILEFNSITKTVNPFYNKLILIFYLTLNKKKFNE